MKLSRIIWVLAAVRCMAQQPDTPPLTVAIVLDTSGSMALKMPAARQFISEFMARGAAAAEFALIKAADTPVVLAGFGSAATISPRLEYIQAKGRTALLDAIYRGVQVANAGRHAQKAVLVISDGRENSSRYTNAEVETAIRQSGVRVHVVAADEPLALASMASHSTLDRNSNPGELAQKLLTAMQAP